MGTKSLDAPRNVREWILWGENQLNASGVYFGHGTDNALDEAAWLVGSTLSLSPEELDAHLRDKLNDAQKTAVRELFAKRIGTRMPAAYLLKEAWFAGLKFYVDERVIVPRSLTGQFIRERFEPWVEPENVRRILDLCTGSGCMAIACAHHFPEARVDAVDISDDALAVAQINVERHALGNRVRLLQSDLLSALNGERYDIIVTNPPYVAGWEMATLPQEYLHEPKLALESGTDGLEAITQILHDAPAHLETEGVLIAEVGNSNETLQAKFPAVPFLWLTSEEGDDSVFLLTAQQLTEHHHRFVVRKR